MSNVNPTKQEYISLIKPPLHAGSEGRGGRGGRGGMEGLGGWFGGGRIFNTTIISLAFIRVIAQKIFFKCTLPICFVRALVFLHLLSQTNK